MISHSTGDFDSPTLLPDTGRMPSLVALRCFEAAARLESFSRAADALHLTHGAVSRAVRSVEDTLGTPLFERRNRRVFLNDHGRLLFDGVHAGLAQMAHAAQAVRQRVAQRPVLLSCEPTLLMRWLIPRWRDFQARHPGCTVHLVAGGGAVDWGSGIDLALRRNDFDWGRSTHVLPLGPERVGPVCQPEKLALFFAPHPLGAGQEGPWLLRSTAPLLHSKTRLQAWPEWARQHGVQVAPASAAGQVVLEHFYLTLQAAAAGLGVAMGPQQLVQDDVQAGRLVAPMGFAADGSQYGLLAPHAWPEASTAQAVATWLQQQWQDEGGGG